MADFVLDGQAVGSRAIAALARETREEAGSVSCKGAHFRDPVRLEGARLTALNAEGATFEKGLFLSNCDCTGKVVLDRVAGGRIEIRDSVFSRVVFTRGLKVGALLLHETHFAQYVSLDDSVVRSLSLRNARFE